MKRDVRKETKMNIRKKNRLKKNGMEEKRRDKERNKR